MVIKKKILVAKNNIYTKHNLIGVKISFYFMILLCVINSKLLGIELSADDPIEYDPKSKHLIATNNVNLLTNKISIKADEVEYSSEYEFASAKGNIILTSNHIFILSDSIEYDLSHGEIITKSCNISYSPVVINASQLYIAQRYQKIDNGTLYFGQPDKFSPNISAKNFEITRFKKIRAKSVVFKVGKIPFFYLPSCTFPIAQRPFWMKNDYGVQSNLGFFLRDDFYLRTNDDVKIGGLLDFYTKRGILFGPAIKIEDNSPTHKIFSETKFGFIHDKGSDKVRNRGNPLTYIKRDRFFLENKNILHFGENFDVIGQLSLWSDSEVVRDFRPSWYYNDQIPDSFIESTYRGENYILSAFSRLRVNNFHDTVSQIPEIHAEMLPKTMGQTNLYHRAFLNYSHLKGSDKYNTKHELDKFDAYYGIFLPINYADWLNFTPIAAIRTTEYLNCTGYKNYSRLITQFGFDTSMLLNGKSNYSNTTWGIHGFKHIIQSVIQYRYIPEVKGNYQNYPVIERNLFDTNLPVIDLVDMRNVDDIQAQNVFRFGLKNTLQTSTDGYIPRDLIKFDIFQDVRLRRNFNENINKKESTLSDTYVVFGFDPVQWLSFQCYNRLYVKKMTLNEMTTSTSIHDGNIWKFSFLTHAIQHDTCQYGLAFSTKLNSRIEFKTSIQYDARIKKFTEQRFSIISMLGHSWNIEYFLAIRNKASRENRCQFSVKLDLVKF